MSNTPEETTLPTKQRLDELHSKLLFHVFMGAAAMFTGILGTALAASSTGGSAIVAIGIGLILLGAIGVTGSVTTVVHTATDIVAVKLKSDS